MSSYEFLSNILVAEFGADPEEVTPDATLASLGLDSLSTIELIQELEAEFGVAIAGRNARFETLGEAARVVDALIRANGA